MQGVAADGNDHLVRVRPANWIPRRSGPPSIYGTVSRRRRRIVYLTRSAAAGLGGGGGGGDPSNFDGLGRR